MAWTNRQKGILKSYQRYAGLADLDYRALLHQVTGATSSRDAHLTQFHFDALMPLLETRAHLAETNGLARGRRPSKLSDWYYWRERAPAKGKASRRELWKIGEIWALLKPYLPETERCDSYLLGIARHATNRQVTGLHDLAVSEAMSLIEALKDRLSHACRRAG